jgi:uncharacterized protein (TIGR03435 family)
MKKTFLLMPLVALFVSHGHCAEAAKTPAFEVASITPCAPGTPAPPGEHMGMVQFVYPGGNFTARATSIKYLMEWAYGLLPLQHSDGPSWLGDDRYDILAKAAGNPTEEQMKLMVQSLLAERFKLKFRRETKDLPTLVLSPGKSAPKFYPSKEGDKHGVSFAPRTVEGSKLTSYHMTVTRFTIAQLNLTFAAVLNRVIVNKTGLDGEFNFELDIVPDENRPSPMDASLLISALRDQLGFTVKAEKGPTDYLVIDSIERVAAGN